MAAKFDNLDDVHAKFTNTFCYYKKKAIYVKAVSQDLDDPTEFVLNIATGNGRGMYIKLSDPEFEYKNFNLGYANLGLNSAWLYRKAIRQYKQGLKKDQLNWRATGGFIPDDLLNFSKPYIKMLENEYPPLEYCEEVLQTHGVNCIAFHRNFAAQWDEIHGDYVYEYQGKKIGVSVGSNIKKFKLAPHAIHLTEALQEAVGV